MTGHKQQPLGARATRFESLHSLEVLEARFEDHVFPTHFHDTFVLEWVIAGADVCHASSHAARSGQLFAHGPGVAHAGGSSGSGLLSYVACYPSWDLVEEVTDLGRDEHPQVGTAVLESKHVRRSAERLFELLLQGTNEREIRKALREVLMWVFDHGAPPTMPSASCANELKHAREYLLAHSDRGVSAEELGEVVGVSRFHLLREFKRVFGITPRQFQISERVARARALMASGAGLAEAAIDAGFADQSHMSRAFKAVTAFTPGALVDRTLSC